MNNENEIDWECSYCGLPVDDCECDELCPECGWEHEECTCDDDDEETSE